MEKSESIAELARALINMQVSLKPVVRDKLNPFLKSKYADLSSVWEVCRDLLQENKLVVIQVSGIDANGAYLETVLAHESGEWISGRYPLKPVKADDPQALGSAVTYARRYSMAAILGIVTEDDDAEMAMGRSSAANSKQEAVQAQPQAPAPVKKRMTQEQVDRLDILKKAGKNFKSKIDSYGWKVERLSDLSFEQAERLIKDFFG